ncbi:MAG: winged helix-turn-helix domain-containing protein [Actinomycetota bacterium]
MRGYRFGDIEADVDRREIRQSGQSVPVDRQVFDLIVYLATHHDRVVTRAELLDEVWGDRFVSSSALSTQIKHARRALGDDGQRQGRIVTIRGVGYRLNLDGAEQHGTDLDVGDRGGLPAPFEDLIGRSEELATVERLIGTGLAVTLIGPGGVGKTRVALEGARRLAAHFGDGVRLVELAPVTGDEDVASAIADVVGVQAAPGEPLPNALCRALAGRELLLVLDNCEHVSDGVLSVVTALGSRCPTVTILATSRAPLGFDGEHLVPVPSLATREAGDGESPPTAAEALLMRRLEATGPGDWDQALVASICRRLDGIPLAIELAAGRARTLGLAELHGRLDQAVDLLAANRPTERHRTLRHTIGWSYDLLPPRHRLLLQRATVFAGPFTLTAAEQVLVGGDLAPSDVTTGLAALADASLLQTLTDLAGGRRFRMLETIRQFGREVAEPEDLSRTTARFVDHMTDWVARSAEQVHGFEPGLWSLLVGIELDNIREAARRAIDRGDHAAAVSLASDMYVWITFDPIDDSTLWAEAVLGRIERDDPLYPRALAIASTRASQMAGDRDEMIARLERECGAAIEIDPVVATQLALLYWFNGDAARAIELNDVSVRIYHERGDLGSSFSARTLTSMAADAIDRDRARREAEAVLVAADRLERPLLRAGGLLCLAGTQAHSDREAALATVTELIEVAREIGSQFHLGSGLRIRSHLLSRLKRLDDADRSYREALEVNGIGDRGPYLWYTVLNLIEHFIRCDRPETAAVAIAAYDRSPAAIQDDLVKRNLARSRSMLADRLGQEQLEASERHAVGLTQAQLLSELMDALGQTDNRSID